MTKKIMVDVAELGRFILTGVTATVGNMFAVWLALLFVPFQIALLAGIVTGLTISFTLSKFFAFRKNTWHQAGGESARFFIVYGVGAISYWTVANVVRYFTQYCDLPPKAIEMGSALIGAGTMLFTSYFGHRFFTYRTHRRP